MITADKVYLPSDGQYPFSGLNTLDPSVISDHGANPICHNMLPWKGLLRKRGGYQQLHTSGSTPSGIPMAVVNFQDADGDEHLVLITTTKQYVFDTGTGAWDNITYQVAAADVNLTGDETDTINWTIATGVQGTWLIITNGKDGPRKWDGETALFELYAPTYTDFVTCKSLAMFYNHLVLVNITKSSNESKLIAWSEIGDLLDFDSDLTSGEDLLTGVRGEIEQCLPLGDRLAIYATESIHTLTYIGGAAIFQVDDLIQDVRLVSPRAIVNLGPVHLLLRRENISAFDGTRALVDIGDKIHRTYREELYLSRRKVAWGGLDSSKNNVYWGVPISETETKVYVLEYDSTSLMNSRWSELGYPARPTGMGFFTRSASLTWDSASLSGVTWSSLGGTWDQGSFGKGFPVRVLALSDGRVMLSDETSGGDAGTEIEGVVDSIDFTTVQTNYGTSLEDFQSVVSRWTTIEFDAMGSSVEVWYSVDGGGKYTLAGEVSLADSWQRYKLDIDVSSRKLRVRFKQLSSAGGFSIRWYRVWLMKVSSR